MQKLIQNPEKYRIGKNYNSSNVVFPVHFEGSNYIVKHARVLGDVIDAYYCIQDFCFYGNKAFSLSKTRLEREVMCLDQLVGTHAPKLVAHGSKVIVREYLEGTNFRDL